MPGAKQTQLQARGAHLRERSQALRERLSDQALALQRPLALADRARRGIWWLKAHPQWLLGLAALPLVLRPRRALGWGLRLWWVWGVWRRVRAALRPRRDQAPWKPPLR